MRNDFVVFILTHGRAGRVKTYNTLREHGYTGKVVLVCDDEDADLFAYMEEFGADNVAVFSKYEIAKTFDEADNFMQRKTIVYARNACFDIARKLGYKYFCEMDDDYTDFAYSFNEERVYKILKTHKLDDVFDILIQFFQNTPVKTIAMAQGGDYVGGGDSAMGKWITMKRKAMNSFICSTDRPFKFIGRVNEDVNTYVKQGMVGDLFLTTNIVRLEQMRTQANKGGMTETYEAEGTHVKSFYTIMYAPSCVKLWAMGNKDYRIHHKIIFNNAVPKIVAEKWKRK